MAIRRASLLARQRFDRLTCQCPDWVRGEALFWAAQTAVWSLAAAGMALLLRREVIPDLPSQVPITPLITVRVAFVAAASAVLRLLYRSPSIRRLPAPSVLAVIVVSCLVAAVIENVIVTPAAGWAMPEMAPHLRNARVKLTSNAFTSLVLWSLGFWVFTGFVVLSRAEQEASRLRQRATDLELALRTNELARLGEQVRPHVLFNALTAVIGCRHDPDAVAEVTNALAAWLRYCLTITGSHEPLGRELDAVEHLLVVHRARRRSAISCQVDSTPEARVLLVPPMIVGPLVENALKYGLQTSPDALSVLIDARIEDGRLVVTVTNSGEWVDRVSGEGGVGLDNLRARLRLVGIEGATVTAVPSKGSVVAEVSLPLASCRDVTRVAEDTSPSE